MQSPLGDAVERLVSAGRLVPSGLIVAIVESKLNGHGYVLDGFPRTVAQAKVLLEREAIAPTVAIEIVVSAGVALERLLGRGRLDDGLAVVRNRLAIYDAETAPAVDWLDQRGLLMRVDGHDSADIVEHSIWRALQHFRRASSGSSLSDAYRIGTARDVSRSVRIDRDSGDRELQTWE